MLFGKTILVTGVASGIGARTAELAGQMGADIIGVDVREPSSGISSFIKGDISTAEGVADIVRQLPNRVDALANVAGLSGSTGKRGSEPPPDPWAGMFELAMAVAHGGKPGQPAPAPRPRR